MTPPLTISLGEVLWDMLPDGKALGGAPTNVAWHASQLGAEAWVASAVGDDGPGREILADLRRMHLNVSTVAVVPNVPTSSVDATLDERGNASYVIHENVAWDFLPATVEMLAAAGRAAALNFGSLGQRHPEARRATHAILDALPPDCITLFDINLRPPYVNRDILLAGFARTVVVKMNHDEAPVLAGMFGVPAGTDRMAAHLLDRHPNIRHVVVTEGANGATWYARGSKHHEPAPPPERMVDTIGAGDSVTAACMMGLLRGWDGGTILGKAMEIASYVCSCRGGTPELPDRLRKTFA